MNDNLKNPHIGTDNFKKHIDENGYYVDKTPILVELIKNGAEVTLYSRPRRFGKSLMMSMLQTFFEYKLDGYGKPVDNRHYFSGLHVMDSGEDVLRHLGQYPVISISLKDIAGKSYLEAMGGFSRLVCALFNHNIDLLKRLDGIVERDYIDKALKRKLDLSDLANSLKILSDCLYKVTGRLVLILIDEYDVPLQNAWIHGYYEEMIDFIREWFSSALKTNPSLWKAVLTGCLRVSKESIFTGLNHPKCVSVLTETRNEYFGFTHDELRQMLKYYEREDLYAEMCDWYDGYTISGRDIFNPFSTTRCISAAVIDNAPHPCQAYWVNTSGNAIVAELIRRTPTLRAQAVDLLENRPITKILRDTITYSDMDTDPDAIWNMMLFTGYVKATDIKYDGILMQCVLKIPNREVKTAFELDLKRWWREEQVGGYDARSMVDAIWQDDAEAVERDINTLLSRSLSIFDYKEDFYHAMMLGLMTTITAETYSNREKGDGKPDLYAIIGDKAVVFEFKNVSSADLEKARATNSLKRQIMLLNRKCKAAATQIKKQRYAEGLMLENAAITQVKCVAIAFCKKRCKVGIL